MFIKEVRARAIKDSRGEKTFEVSIVTYKGKFVSSAPSGKSKGAHEVGAYGERGIQWSLKMFNSFSRKLIHKNFMMKNIFDLKFIEDSFKDFESRHGRVGADVLYALEVCLLKAVAHERKQGVWKFIFDSLYDGKNKVMMPVPVGNCIGGGMHSKSSNNEEDVPDFQEFLLIPKEKKFSANVTKMVYAYESAGRLLRKEERKFFNKRNDEGAWKTSLTNEGVLDILKEIGKKFDVRIGVDVAASTFCDNQGYYNYKNKKLMRDRQEQVDYIRRLVGRFGLFYVEDPIQQEDFSGFMEILDDVQNKDNNHETLIVGDDLTVTKYLRLRTATRSKAINAAIIKPNQVGSLLEVIKAVKHCKENNIKIVFSHRSGETMDDVLADLAVGFQADYIKTGIHGKERLVKLRRVMEIEKSLSN